MGGGTAAAGWAAGLEEAGGWGNGRGQEGFSMVVSRGSPVWPRQLHDPPIERWYREGLLRVLKGILHGGIERASSAIAIETRFSCRIRVLCFLPCFLHVRRNRHAHSNHHLALALTHISLTLNPTHLSTLPLLPERRNGRCGRGEGS